jgi:alpha-L-fucosidase
MIHTSTTSLFNLALVTILISIQDCLAQTLPSPTPEQLHYLESELTMFMHFSVCTFNDGCDGGQQNCGYQGKNIPYPASTFNPTDVNTDQWAQVALNLNAKQVCLTVHHSGGFALWPTNASDYSIKASPFGLTGRDIVAEFVNSMRNVNIEPCFYIVLNMDCAEANNTVERYVDIQRNMLTELLTGYGPITRLWWDMYQLDMGKEWNPGMDRDSWANLTSHAKSLAPQTLLLPGSDGCLVGGETGSGSYPCFLFNEGPTGYACQEMNTPPAVTPTLIFSPHEQDHTILNPGDMWWWVSGHNWLSAAELFETYLVTIGRGNTYILNMPPNTTGIIPEYLYNETNQLGAATKASFSPESALARITNQTVECGPSSTPLILPPPSGGFVFDAVILEEDISLGNQRISGYELDMCTIPNGQCTEDEWVKITGQGLQTIVLGVTIGRKVIERGFNNTNGLSISATGLRFKCNAAFPAGTTTAYIKSFSAHKMVPPAGWPRPPFNCHQFNCTCKGMADYYGVGSDGNGGWGCAPPDAQNWWIHDAVPCEDPSYSCCAASDYTKNKPPFPGC